MMLCLSARRVFRVRLFLPDFSLQLKSDFRNNFAVHRAFTVPDSLRHLKHPTVFVIVFVVIQLSVCILLHPPQKVNVFIFEHKDFFIFLFFHTIFVYFSVSIPRFIDYSSMDISGGSFFSIFVKYSRIKNPTAAQMQPSVIAALSR